MYLIYNLFFFNNALKLLIVNGIILANGVLVRKIVEEERDHVDARRRYTRAREVKNAMVYICSKKVVIPIRVQVKCNI